MIINAVKMIFMERIWPCGTAHPPTAIPQSSLVCLRRPTSCLSKKDFQSLYAQPHEQTKGNNVEQWRALVPQVKKQFNISSYKCFIVYFSTSSCLCTSSGSSFPLFCTPLLQRFCVCPPCCFLHSVVPMRSSTKYFCHRKGWWITK